MRWGALIALSLAFAPMHVEAKSVHKEFSEVWLERDNRYVGQAEEAANKSNEAVTAFAEAAKQNKPEWWREGVTMLDAIEAASYANGRGSTLRDFRILMAKKPKAERAELWLQERMDALKLRAAEVQRNDERVKQVQEENAGLVELITVLEAAAKSRGGLRGELDELVLIDQNAQSYFRAKSEEAERRAAVWRAIGQSMQAASANQPRFTNCTRIGNNVNCMSN